MIFSHRFDFAAFSGELPLELVDPVSQCGRTFRGEPAAKEPCERTAREEGRYCNQRVRHRVCSDSVSVAIGTSVAGPTVIPR